MGTESSISDSSFPILLLVVSVVFIIYFFLIAPRQRQKKDDGFFNSLKVGDSIVTIGGIHGVIVNMVDNRILLQTIGGDARLLVERHSISPEGTDAIYRKKIKEVKPAKVAKPVPQKTKAKAQKKTRA